MVDDMDIIRGDVSELKNWRGVTEHRVSTLEAQRHNDVKQVIRLEAEVSQVDRKVSRIEGGIEFLKWSIPVSISAAMAIGGVIAWVVTTN